MTFPNLSAYLTHTEDGKSVIAQGLLGNTYSLWNKNLGVWEQKPVGSIVQHCFNNTAMLDGVPNQNLVEGKPHYVYLYMPDGVNVKFAFSRRRFSGPTLPRYGFDQGGVPSYNFPNGDRGTLLGMVTPIGGKFNNIMAGATARVLCSHSPFTHFPQQYLPAVTAQGGGTFAYAAPTEINTQLRVTSCAWAWKGAKGSFSGRIANNGPVGTTAWIRGFVRSLEDPSALAYGPTAIIQFTSAGQNIPFSGTSLNRALDDGAYHFGIEGWTAGGAVHLQIEHTVDAWL